MLAGNLLAPGLFGAGGLLLLAFLVPL